MAKQSGLGARFVVGGYDISGDIQALDNIGGAPTLGDFTDITQLANARLGLLRDGQLSASVYMDPANAHPVLSALPTADELMSFFVPPLAVGAAPTVACLNAKQIGYDEDRKADGSLILKVEGKGNGYGLEWCAPLTAGLRTDTAATHGASVDGGAASSFGAQAYLQVTAFTGTSVTVTVEDSADNATFAAVTGLTFTAVSAAPATQRLATAGTATLRRYVRVSSSGTFTSATFAVAINRNPVATAF